MFRFISVIIITVIFSGITSVSARSIPGVDPSTMAIDPDPGYAEKIQQKEDVPPQDSSDQKPEEKQHEPARADQAEVNVDPFITGLGIKKLDKEPYSVELTWNVSSRNESPIYVARSQNPITSRQSVMNADNLTSPPLSPQATSFIDKNVPNGEYYYAVLVKEEIAARGNIILKKGANVSPEAVMILREDYTKGPPIYKDKKLDQFRVFGLTAVDTEDKVLLKWLPAEAKNIKYTIYRGTTPLDTKERIETAQRLGVVEEGTEEFTDINPMKNRSVFYGVTVTDKETNREVTSLIYRKSYVEHAHGKLDYSQILAQFPGAIIVVLTGQNSLRVYWTDPESKFDEISVFRSNSPISSEDKLKEAVKVGDVKKGVKQYEDINIEPGNYFYAIFPKIDGQVKVAFLQEKTFTVMPVSILPPKEVSEGEKLPEKEPEAEKEPEKKEQEVADSEVKEDSSEDEGLLYFRMISSRDSVKLIWEVGKYNPGVKYLIFRSQKFMQTYRDVQRHGQLLEELPSYIKEYIDESIPEGIYYYALVVEKEKIIDETLVAGKNYVLEPAIISAAKEDPQDIADNTDTTDDKVDKEHKDDIEETEPNEKIVEEELPKQDKIPKDELTQYDDEMMLHQKKLDELNKILATTFIKNKYGEAVEQLKPFTGNHGIPEGIRARAMFYSGLSYYNMRKYKQALFYFSNTEVRSFYPMRSDFWIKRSVERIR